MSLSDPYLLVEHDAQLAELCQRLAGAPWLTVDTEFLREKTYYPQLCLIQVASADTVAVIDPLKLADLGPFVALLRDTAITKVFHAARQDLELFWQRFHVLPRPIFDTQIAAPLLGYPDQMGYAALVKARLGIEVDKAETRTDWSRRPLTESQLDYAAGDARYLAELYPALLEELQRHGRLAWLDDDFVALTDPAAYENPPEQAWRRLRGLHKFRGPALANAQALAAWRETRAQAEDKPRKWILSDDALLTLARIKVKSVQDLKRVRGLPAPVIERQGEALVTLLMAASGRKPEPLPDAERPTALTEDQEAVVDVLMGVMRTLAAAQSLNPSVIGSRKDVQALVRGERAQSPLLRGWRKGLAGQKLLDVLEGRCSVRVDSTRLTID